MGNKLFGIMSKDGGLSLVPITCGHCSNLAHMRIVGVVIDYKNPKTEILDEYYGPGYEEGEKFEIYKCPKCKLINIRSHYWSGYEDDGIDEEILDSLTESYLKVIFPLPLNNIPLGLSDSILQLYVVAENVKKIDSGIYAITIRKLLEMVCKEHGAENGKLVEMLNDLVKKNVLPTKLYDIASGIRTFGNIGAHDDLITNNEIPLLNALVRAILEYLYTAPHLAKIAEDRLKEIKDNIQNS